MYKLKPVFRVPAELQISCSMYKLKNVHEKRTQDEIAFQESDRNLNDFEQLSDQEIEALLKKQNEVLNVLEQLELRLKKLSVDTNDIKENDKKSVSSTSNNFVGIQCKEKSESEISYGITNLINENIVVFADPENPPYSLLALPVLWPTVSWDISYHVHSTITKDLKALDTIKLFKNVSSKDKKKTVKVFVIWQCIHPSPKIMSSPTDVLLGEVSLLRLFNKHLCTETTANAQANSDKALALIEEISNSKSDRTSELYNLINDSTKILDVKQVAVWSLLFKKNKSSPILEQLTKMILS